VALVAQGGTRIGANGNHARALVQYRKRKCCNGKVLAFAAIVERKESGMGSSPTEILAAGRVCGVPWL